jgi:hypothetical protein
MDAQTILATLPGSRPHERLQVVLTQGRHGNLTIELREQHYAEGIGWFDQRALSLEPGQFKRLQAVLGTEAAVWEELEESPATLPFPGPADLYRRRPAVGDGG